MLACLHCRFEQHVADTPDAIAVVDSQGFYTYQQINAAANRLGNLLKSQGVGKGVTVGICLERSNDLIVSILAVIKAGGAYVPIDRDHPAERISFMLRDACSKVLITKEAYKSQFSANYNCSIICLDAEQANLKVQSEENLNIKIDLDDLLYVIYTSGSTGRPKGVMVTHRNVSRLFPALADSGQKFSNKDVWSLYHSPAFGYSAWEIWGPLLHGGRLVIVPPHLLVSGVELRNFLKAQSVTVLSLTPSIFRHIILNAALEDSESLSFLRMIALSGEAINSVDIKQWFEHSDGKNPSLISTYAITETGGQVAFRQLHSSDTNFSLLGKVLSDTKVYLLDEKLRPVESGTEGELCVAGPGLALGYLNQPELTAERFIIDPFGDGSEKRLYRTGDRGKMRPDGEIELIGRQDYQVKLNGYRIELGEIESMLQAHPAVAESAVLLREDVGSVPRLVGYVVTNQKQASSAQPVVSKHEDSEAPEFWPSLVEYQIYDELLYHLMTEEPIRNEAYKAAIRAHVTDKVVLDVGTGKDVILARHCIDAGAKRVYAIEVLEDAAQQAKELVVRLGLEEKIIVIHSDSASVDLPEKVDVWTEGIIGNIGSSDGIIPIANDVRRLLKTDAVKIPSLCTTYFAAVELPESMRENPSFKGLAGEYAEQIFEQAGRRFDIRLCVRNFPKENLISDPATFEDLDFSGFIDPEFSEQTSFHVKHDSCFDGFLLWTYVTTTEGVSVDYLENQQAWLPVYFPIVDDGLSVAMGDQIDVSWRRTLSSNNINPDYEIKVTINHKNGKSAQFSYKTCHHEEAYQSTGIHRRLFAKADFANSELSTPKLARYLAQKLPNYMVPSAFVFMDSMPLNASGKLDRLALPIPESKVEKNKQKDVQPTSELEATIIDIWKEILEIESVKVEDNFFFDLGGHSLPAMQAIARLKEILQVDLSMRTIFEAPTVAKLAEKVSLLQKK